MIVAPAPKKKHKKKEPNENHTKKERKAKVSAVVAVDLDVMPSLSNVDVATGEKTSILDVLRGLGFQVGSKVCSVSVRGVYVVVAVNKASDTISLDLTAKIISFAELWEMVDATRVSHARLPAATSAVLAAAPTDTSSGSAELLFAAQSKVLPQGHGLASILLLAGLRQWSRPEK